MYVVQSFGSGSNFYTDSFSEAEEVYFARCNVSEFVELLKGEPGHYETIKQSW